jgi:flagellar basal-body rod protein FlgB
MERLAMTDPILNDDALRAAQFTLNGLARREEVISRNLSNVDTPGFQAQTVDFESSLARAMTGGETMPMTATNPAHMGGAGSQPAPAIQTRARQGMAWRADGNDVDIDVELNQMAETGIRYQAISQLASKKLILLRSIAQAR